MKNLNKKDIVPAVATVALGILFLTLKGDFVGIMMTIIGASLILYAIAEFFLGDVYGAIAESAVGAIIILFGWLIAAVAFYILAVALIVYGAVKIRFGITLTALKAKFTFWIVPIVCGAIDCALGFMLFFNRGGTVDWIFIVTGIILILNGVAQTVDAFVIKPKYVKENKGKIDGADGSEFHF